MTTTSKPRRRLILKWALGVLFLIGLASAAAGPIMSRVEQPDYTVEASEGAFEVRSYGPIIIAEAEVAGERKPAIQEGFRLIAGYIFGGNKPNTKISMTAPVQQQSQTISMTAPVQQQSAGTGWRVSFVMPKSWTMETLPEPNDARVLLKPMPQRRLVAVTFSGRATDEAIQSQTAALRSFAEARKLKTTGEPLLAFYNPPWTLPFLRRNEIMLEVPG